MYIQTIHVVRKLNDPSNITIPVVIQSIEEWIGAHPHVRLVDEASVSDSTLVIAVGGDGTMLYAMRLSATCGAKCIGVHIGNVGFLAEITYTSSTAITEVMCEMLSDITSNTPKASVERRVAIGMDSMPIACNDIVISPMRSDRTFAYDLTIDGVSAGSHRANGVIVSTPTGSTAYSLSVGGALIYPSAEVFQIVPIAAMSLTSRPLIVPASSRISVSVGGTEALIATMDGMSSVVNSRRFMIRRHIRDIQMIHLEGWSFFDVLSRKLGWNHAIG